MPISPVAVARDVLKKYDIKKAPVNVEKICDDLEITIQYADFSDIEQQTKKPIAGVIQKRPGSKCIIIVNDNDWNTRARFTIAHELGHYFLHLANEDNKLITSFRRDQSPRETEANKFAAELLMPEKLIRYEYNQLVIPVSDSLAEIFDVSKQAMKVRLESLGLKYV